MMGIYEIRLCRSKDVQLIFVTRKAGIEEAAHYARAVIEKHPGYDRAEIWCRTKLVRTI
jgi:hypothetical protein